jgi:hypothetical protein
MIVYASQPGGRLAGRCANRSAQQNRFLHTNLRFCRPETCADIENLAPEVAFRSRTDIEQNVVKFVEWYRNFYGV